MIFGARVFKGACIIAIGVAGGFTTVILPLIVSAASVEHGLAAGSGMASSEMGGVAVGALIYGFLVAKHDKRLLAASAALVAAAANAITVIAEPISTLFVLRFIAGLGGGGLLATFAAAAGTSPKPDRLFGLFLSCAFISATVGFKLLTPLTETYGLSSIFLTMVLVDLLMILISLGLPGRPSPIANTESETSDAPEQPLNIPVVFALLGILSFFIGIGGIWPMIPEVGKSLGVHSSTVASVLASASLAAIAGALTAAALGDRIGRLIPLAIGLSGVALSLLTLAITDSGALFSVAPLTLLFAWNFSLPYLMGVLAALDKTGRAVAFNMTLQYFGFSVGPMLAAALIGAVGIKAALWAGVITTLAALSFYAAGLRLAAQKKAPATIS